jgi:ABC-type molybdate transport system permease subunit
MENPMVATDWGLGLMSFLFYGVPIAVVIVIVVYLSHIRSSLNTILDKLDTIARTLPKNE